MENKYLDILNYNFSNEFAIDYFKKVNDIYGHSFGDKVLKQVSSILQENIRETDYLGRYGGDEFILMMNDYTNRKASEHIKIIF